MQANRAPSPFRAPSPYGSSSDPQYSVQQSLPTGPAKVGPGSITYTTSTGPDGRIIYEPYRAVAASYHTPSGVVSGIQWVKADPTSIPPPGAQPYIPGGAGSWNPGPVPPNHDWQRAEEKRRKHEEKAEAKRIRELEATGQKDSDYELRMARERDAQSTGNRDRRKSFNSGPQAIPPVTFPSMSGGTGYPVHPSQLPGYPSSPYAGVHASFVGPTYPSGVNGHSRNPSASGGYGDLTKQFGNLDIDRQKDYERDRKISNTKRSHKYSTNDGGYERARTISGNYIDRNAYQPATSVYPPAPEPFNNPQTHYSSSSYVTPSPNVRPGEISYGNTGVSGYPTSNNTASTYSSSPAMSAANIARSTTPFGNSGPQVYPRGHILEGQPIVSGGSNPRSRAPSRAASPNPSSHGHADFSRMGKSPRMPAATIPGEPQQLPAPEAFSRPINGSNSFTPFDIMKIVDMEDLYDTKLPKMPGILASHDIYPEDWKRCMHDLGRSWTGQLPVPSFGTDSQPRRSTLAADLVNLWNDSFFFNRGVELILCKGKERRTGPQSGLVDNRLTLGDDEDDDEDSSSSLTSDSELEYNRVSGPYGRPIMAEVQEARRRRYEEKKENRRRRKARRKAKAREKTYSVYISCSSRGPPPTGYAVQAGPQMMMSGSYGAAPSVAAGYNATGAYIPPTAYSASPAYGPPVGIPKTRSHGYGGNY